MELQASSSRPEGLSDDLAERSEAWADDLWEPGLSEDDYWSSLAPLDDDPLPDWDAEGELVGPATVPDQFEQALGRLQVAADDLVRLGIDPDLVLADRDRLIGWAGELERTRNKLACPDQSLINLMEGAGCRIDGPLGLFVSPQAYLHALHGIGLGEARARVRAASVLAPSRDMAGLRVEPRFPVLAQASSRVGSRPSGSTRSSRR